MRYISKPLKDNDSKSVIKKTSPKKSQKLHKNFTEKCINFNNSNNRSKSFQKSNSPKKHELDTKFRYTNDISIKRENSSGETRRFWNTSVI